MGFEFNNKNNGIVTVPPLTLELDVTSMRRHQTCRLHNLSLNTVEPALVTSPIKLQSNLL
jgi:hypothetical protein